VDGTITELTREDLSNVDEIRPAAFMVTPLRSVEIPSNVKIINESAFMGCEGLETLTIDDGVEEIGSTAFAMAPIKEIVLPKTITTLREFTFQGNTALESIRIPSNITTLGAGVFDGCSNLTEVTMEGLTPPSVTSNTFPANVTSIYVPYGAYDTYKAQWSSYASKIVRLPAIPSTITVTVNNYLGELVNGASVTITGNGQTFTGTTNENGVFTQGDLQPATYAISVADMDGFDTPEPVEVVVEENTQNSAIITYLEKSLTKPVYGVSWVNDASTTMTRTDDAVGMTYSITDGKVTSDFDHVFPYNQMKRQVIDGNTFVYVPEMWFRVETDSDQKITSIAVSETQGDGDNWYKTRPFYYGAYGASSDGSKLKSVSGVGRFGNVTRAVARQRASSVGAEYHQRDVYSYTILMFLWWIEFADKNSQNIMQGCNYGQTTGNTDTIYNEENGNNFCVSGYNLSTQQMVWHGIEDYIGNGFEWEDGMTGDGVKGGIQYVSDNYKLYDDYSGSSKMSALSFNAPTTDGNCLEAFGWDNTKPFLCQPIATRSDSSYASGFCDLASVTNNICSARGSMMIASAYGMCFFSRESSGGTADFLCCRLVKRV
jgi:hypothetical protein